MSKELKKRSYEALKIISKCLNSIIVVCNDQSATRVLKIYRQEFSHNVTALFDLLWSEVIHHIPQFRSTYCSATL